MNPQRTVELERKVELERAVELERKVALQILALVVMVLGANPANAGEISTVSCDLEQLTMTMDSGTSFANLPKVNRDGSRIAWTSSRDLVGLNPDLNFELFRWREGLGIEQLTDTADVFAGAIQSYIDASGERIFFEGNADLVPGSNPDGNFEEFIWDETDGYLQVTDTTKSLLCGKSISADGNRVFFGLAGEDLLGTNPDLNLEQYMYDVSSGTLTQLTSTIGSGVCAGSPSHDGTEFLFSTDDDVGPANPEGNIEAYRWREGFGIDAVTSTAAGDSFIQTSGDGLRAAVTSSADLVPGLNVDGNLEVFLWEASAGFIQLTESDTGDARRADISADGSRIAFEHTADLTGGNPDFGQDIFLWDGQSLTQITDMAAEAVAASVDLDQDGSHITFRTTGDPVPGGNPDAGIEIYLARCSVLIFADGFESGDTSAWSSSVP